MHSRYRTEAHQDVVGRFNERQVIIFHFSGLTLCFCIIIPYSQFFCTLVPSSLLWCFKTELKTDCSRYNTSCSKPSKVCMIWQITHELCCSKNLSRRKSPSRSSLDDKIRQNPDLCLVHFSRILIIVLEKNNCCNIWNHVCAGIKIGHWIFWLLYQQVCLARGSSIFSPNKKKTICFFRFLLSLGSCKDCLVIDDQLRILPISTESRNIAALPPKTKVRDAFYYQHSK